MSLAGTIRARQQRAAQASGGLYTASTYSGTYVQQQYNRDLSRNRAQPRSEQEPTDPTSPTLSSELEMPLQIERGMEIRLVPLVYFTKSANHSEPVECGICLTAFTDGDPLRVPECGHQFHSKCLRTWFNRGGPCCPTCRHVVTIPEEAADPAPQQPDASPISQRSRLGSAAASVVRRVGLGRPSRPPRDPSVFLDEYY